VAKVDAAGNILSRVDLRVPAGDSRRMRGPRGLVLHPAWPRLYVLNRISNTITVLDTNAFTGATYNWRGDNTQAALSGHFAGKLGGTPLTAQQFQFLAEYLLSLQHHPNPHRSLDNTLPDSLNGANPFQGQLRFQASAGQCLVCHGGIRGSNYNIDDPAATGSVDFVRTPPLQTLYQRAFFTPGSGTSLAGFGYSHDGSSAALPMAHPYAPSGLVPADFADVAAYLMCFETSVLPAVGHSVTVTLANRSAAAITSDLDVMEQQAATTGRVDLVARGTLAGRQRVFQADAFEGLWLTDRAGDPGMSRAALLELLQPGDALTFMGVLPGMGIAYSRDQNDNEIHDGDEGLPSPFFLSRAGGIQLHVPGVAGWVTEWNTSLTGPWQALNSPPVRGAEEAVFPDVSGMARRFFRLRRTW
jgi:hypothetical protein